ncbi:hypothetical protein KQI41_14125 [Tissierella pigra]|uniref:Uncharacterized protein n=1 Tax=Tissierella pigra TaxID=2607614 RepID=A0A6N7XWT8_9FIRM|nr:hypothetical protein [Tissierella pigra]MBU5427521.1 hypothetical protein [Tissierella pigra]MSU00270.1 hypothetical protein [Tissierella pigra]
MINRINTAYESIKVNSSTKSHEIKEKEVEKTNNYAYNSNPDYSFIDLDRLITAVIERYLNGVAVGDGFLVTNPIFHDDTMDKRVLKFDKEFFDTIKPLIQSAYDKKSLGDIEYPEYESHFVGRVYVIASLARAVVKEFSDASNKVTYDEQSLRKAADDYFMKEISESDIGNIDSESIVDQNDRIRDIAKFRIMNDKECRSILAELKTLI